MSNDGWYGSNWIRKEKRLAIYLRDNMSCIYCRKCAEDGAELSLDHLKCRSNGGSNEADNLVCCCGACNRTRRDTPLKEWAKIVAEMVGESPEAVLIRVKKATKKRLPMTAARKMMKMRL